jgi:hypothetical protein
VPLDLPMPAEAGLRHQGNAGAGRRDNSRARTLITLLGSPEVPTMRRFAGMELISDRIRD